MRLSTILVAGFLAATFLVCSWLSLREGETPPPILRAWNTPPKSSPGGPVENSVSHSLPVPITDQTLNGDALTARLMDLRRRLASGLSPEDARRAFAEMSASLLATPKKEAMAALLFVLERGDDIVTGLPFKIGMGGNLTEAPTLRVWMLDQLGRLDAETAGDYAATIYARHDSADEWAVALRNDWRQAAPTGRIEAVRARALELLANEQWARQPSVGFLEALDISVATLTWEAVPQFERWLDPAESRALRAGAWIALDRLMMEVPEDFLPALVQNHQWLGSQPFLRAGLVARADLGSERQRRAVEVYLNRDDVGDLETKRFFELVPNAGATVSYNLVTTSRTPRPQRVAELDRMALATVREWRAKAKFPQWDLELTAAELRLSESVASAIRGGYLTQ